MYQFKKGKAVWMENPRNQYNQFVGFHTRLELDKEQRIVFAIAARSYYRLYIDGQMVATGPARTAKHYCRVDVIQKTLIGSVDIAIEVTAFSKPGEYCNDCTLESGLLCAEISDDTEHILSATGDEGWSCVELLSRRSQVETMSHSRGIVEYYDLDEASFDWRKGNFDKKERPAECQEKVQYLQRRAPYPTYRPIQMGSLMEVADVVSNHTGDAGFVLTIARDFNKEWYEMLPEENCFLESLRKEKGTVFTGKYMQEIGGEGERIVRLLPGKNPMSCTWGMEKSELGFLDFSIQVKKECTMDVINSDHLNLEGELKSNTYVSRYVLKAGNYHITTLEPKLTKYVKIIFRTDDEVMVTVPQILDDSFPDSKNTFFQCSDGELNEIYEGAKRTLRLSTLDIFMDCPQRERGGWLCDSLFSAHGTWQLFGDHSVEEDFIENFMLVNGSDMWHGFFPEVYPGSKEDSSDPGIANWSFWLIAELWEYYERSGNRKYVDVFYERVKCFMNGMLSLRRESGLIEGMKSQFVDWSLSNRSFSLEPISIPNNCLAVYILERMAELYDVSEWKKAADEMREIIETMDESPGIFGGGGDGAEYKEGKLKRTDCATESGAALELWSGFHRDDKTYKKIFVNTMGTCPEYRANPNIGKSNLFIGLMLRFSVLADMGEIDTLVKEWKDLYLPELRDGAGTFFENYNAFSGCHGFNGATGALIVNEVLGLGQPKEKEKKILIKPHPGKLRWAKGSAACSDGQIFLSWSADAMEHRLTMQLLIPEGWEYELELSFELKGWEIILNGNREE